MLNITQVEVGMPILLMEFGVAIQGFVNHVDVEQQRIAYSTDEGIGDVLLNPAPEKGGGALYEVAKHNASDLIVAYFKGWQSDKYVRYELSTGQGWSELPLSILFHFRV